MIPAQQYQNPLLQTDFPDPSIIDTGPGGYFAYATHDEFSPTLTNILLSQSQDLIHWSEPTGALAEPPTWARQSRRFWCPQVVYVNGQYRLYYATESDAAAGHVPGPGCFRHARQVCGCGGSAHGVEWIGLRHD